MSNKPETDWRAEKRGGKQVTNDFLSWGGKKGRLLGAT